MDDKTDYQMADLREEKDWLKTTHEACDTLREAAGQIEHFACRLAYFMPQCAALEPLMWLCQRLRVQEEMLSKATGKKCGEDARAASEHSGNMLRAILAGVFTAPKNGLTDAEREAMLPLIDHANKAGSPVRENT